MQRNRNTLEATPSKSVRSYRTPQLKVQNEALAAGQHKTLGMTVTRRQLGQLKLACQTQ